MIDILIDTTIDFLKLLPFLYIAFLIIEFIEHKLSNKSKIIVEKSGKFGPFFGGLLGLVPQCGFSALATNLYATRILSLGTLISIYLATSDEMLPILISEAAPISLIVKILAIKFVIGIISGFTIDFALRKKNQKHTIDYHICNDEHCNCEKENIFLSALKHTINIGIFILLTTLLLNTLFVYVGEDFVSKLFMKNSPFGPFISSLIGLIPNCGASVMITELYLKGAISFSSLISGLLTGTGVALLVLFKTNKNIKENITILALIYFIGAISGVIIEIIEMII